VPSIQTVKPWLLPIGLMACLLVILMPLPTPMMDLLLAGNLGVAVIVLLTAIHVRSPLEFSVFPTLLLATTLSRLVLNIATTRLILTNAAEAGESAAGGVVETFGQFVAGNQVEVGLVIFLIMVVVQFVVITKGATRISEVAARFSLDAMPGRQSAIEADLNAGKIDAEQAASRRSDLTHEADFYAAMDGAGKFVRGDAVAGLVITAINVVCGLYLGIFVYGMELGTAASVFTRLTIGDGLVSQVPSLLISLAAGVLVTRGTRPTNLPDRFVSQLLGNANALFVAGGFLLLLVVTGLPAIPMILLGSGCVLIATTLFRKERADRAAAEQQQRESDSAAEATPQKRVEDFLTVDPLEVAIGLGLLPLADPGRGGDLMQRIASLRNQMAAEIGIVLPKVRVRDDATLEDQSYEIRLFGDFVASGQLRTDKLLARGQGRTTGQLKGERLIGPDGRVTGVWIDPIDREQALIYGYKTQTAPAVLADHLEQVARGHADELLSRDATKHLLDELQQVAPAMVQELVPETMKIADVQKVLQGLLREAIPIRQLGIILEALGDAAAETKDTEQQIECVRRRLARTLCVGLRDASGLLRVIELDSAWGSNLQDITCDAIEQAVKNLRAGGYPAVLLVVPELRRPVKELMTRSGIDVHVLSTAEITSDTQVEIVHVVGQRETTVAA
jgi:flagellar biosynthesis protein FlhA